MATGVFPFIIPSMAHRPKHILEYAALRFFVGLAGWLPLRAALGLAWILAALSFLLMRRRVAEAQRRLRQVFGPDTPASQLKRWAWLSWRNLFFNVMEVARAPRAGMEPTVQHLDTGDLARFLDLQRTSGGFVLAVCHMGNWELAGYAVRHLGLPLFVMMRGQSNPLVSLYLNRVREHFNVGAIERHQALGSIVKRIKAGEIFTILPDIRAKTEDSSVVVPFLGHPAHLMGGMALFARLANRPIVTCITTRQGWTRHVWEFQEPLYPDPALHRDEDILRLTTEVAARFDQAIRQHPDQYFWYNKRWVLDDRF